MSILPQIKRLDQSATNLPCCDAMQVPCGLLHHSSSPSHLTPSLHHHSTYQYYLPPPLSTIQPVIESSEQQNSPTIGGDSHSIASSAISITSPTNSKLTSVSPIDLSTDPRNEHCEAVQHSEQAQESQVVLDSNKRKCVGVTNISYQTHNTTKARFVPSISLDSRKNSISTSIQKSRGQLTRMLSIDQDRGESIHQQQLNLQHQYQQQLDQLHQQKEQQQSDPQHQLEETSQPQRHIKQQSLPSISTSHAASVFDESLPVQHNLPDHIRKANYRRSLSTTNASTESMSLNSTHSSLQLQPILKSPIQASPIQQHQFQFQNVGSVSAIKHGNISPHDYRRQSLVHSKHQRSASTSSQFSKTTYLPVSHPHQNPYHQNHPNNVPKQKSKESRDLSEEGWLRVQTFQQTRSTSSGLGSFHKNLRLSADNTSRKTSGPTSKAHSRSASCLPISKFKSFSMSREDPNHLAHPSVSFKDAYHSPSRSVDRPCRSVDRPCRSVDRSVDRPCRSVDRFSLSPKKSLDRGDGLVEDQVSCSRHRTPEKRCEKRSALRSAGSSESKDVPAPNSPTGEAASAASGQQSTTTGLPSGTKPNPSSTESRSRRSQFRRAISLFSLSCDKETERSSSKDKGSSSQQKILRPPTRHFYRKGLSGLPIECGTRTLTIAY